MFTKHLKKPLLLLTALCIGHSSVHATPPQDHLTISRPGQLLRFWFSPKHGWRARSYDQRYPGCTREQIHRVYKADGVSLPDLLRNPNNLHWLPDPQEADREALYVGLLGLPGGMPSRRFLKRARKDLEKIVLEAVRQEKTCRLQVAMQEARKHKDFSDVYEKIFGAVSSEEEAVRDLAIFDLTVGEVRKLSNYRHHFFTRKQELQKSSSSSRTRGSASEEEQKDTLSDDSEVSNPPDGMGKSNKKSRRFSKKRSKGQKRASTDTGTDSDLPNPSEDAPDLVQSQSSKKQEKASSEKDEQSPVNRESTEQRQALGKPLPTHGALMERLAQDLGKPYSEVSYGIAAETALVRLAGVTRKQDGAHFRPGKKTTHTNFWLRLSDSEGMELMNYYMKHFPGLIRGFEREDGGWMRVDMDTGILYEQVSPQLGKGDKK